MNENENAARRALRGHEDRLLHLEATVIRLLVRAEDMAKTALIANVLAVLALAIAVAAYVRAWE